MNIFQLYFFYQTKSHLRKSLLFLLIDMLIHKQKVKGSILCLIFWVFTTAQRKELKVIIWNCKHYLFFNLIYFLSVFQCLACGVTWQLCFNALATWNSFEEIINILCNTVQVSLPQAALLNNSLYKLINPV